MSNHACTFFIFTYHETGNRQKWLLPWSLRWIQDGITDWGLWPRSRFAKASRRQPAAAPAPAVPRVVRTTRRSKVGESQTRGAQRLRPPRDDAHIGSLLPGGIQDAAASAAARAAWTIVVDVDVDG